MTETIRAVKLGDENILAHIQTESWKHAFNSILDPDTLEKCTRMEPSLAMYRSLLLQRKGHGYLLSIDDQPHCIAWWDEAREEKWKGYAELICIHSLPDHWHEGYGSVMMEHVLREIRSEGYDKVMLNVFEDNLHARAFYEKYGFVTDGKHRNSIKPYEIVYTKTL